MSDVLSLSDAFDLATARALSDGNLSRNELSKCTSAAKTETEAISKSSVWNILRIIYGVD
jgi:hypothetical protein